MKISKLSSNLVVFPFKKNAPYAHLRCVVQSWMLISTMLCLIPLHLKAETQAEIETLAAPSKQIDPAIIEVTKTEPAKIEPVKIEMDKLKIDIKGQFMLRGEFREFTDLRGPRDIYLLRQRTDLTFRVNPDIYVFIQPQFAKAFGELNYRPNSTTANQEQPTSGIFYDSNVMMHQAYVSYFFAPQLEFRGGRQALSYGDELLIGGGLGWQLYGRSFDAFKFVYTYDLGTVDLFASQLVGTDISGPIVPERNLFGLYSQWKLGEGLKEVDLYYFYYLNDYAPNKMALNTFGTRWKSTLGRWNYRMEADYQSGTQTASQIDLEVGFLTLPSSGTRFSIGGLTASKDFNQLFPAAHRWIGTADLFGRRNITGAVIKGTTKLGKNLSYQADLFRLYRATSDAPVYYLAGTIPLGRGLASDSMDLGTELDQVLKLDISKNVLLIASMSILFPGAYMAPLLGDHNALYGFLEMDINF